MDGFYSFFLSRSVKDLLFNWLTETEKSILKNSDPVSGHLNYVDYFYWWKDKKGNNFVAVRTSSPQHGFEPISASRLTKN